MADTIELGDLDEYQPQVTAVMITGKYTARIPLALAAVTAYQQQTWRNRDLLIITDGFSLLERISPVDPSIREIRRGKQPLGALRNVGLCQAGGNYLIQWDDDDWSAPDRIAVQMTAMRMAIRAGHGHDTAITLYAQVRHSFATNNSLQMLAVEPCGLHGTILHPQTAIRYEEVGRHEDSRFVKLFPNRLVVHNRPSLYLRFEHGHNTWSRQHIMRNFTTGTNRSNLDPTDRDYLDTILRTHYACWQSESARLLAPEA